MWSAWLRDPRLRLRWGLIAVLCVAAWYRLRNVTTPLIETFADREIYDAYVARAFYTHGFNLLNPPIQEGIAFGVLDNQFEIYPFVVAAGYLLFGEQVVLGRLVSIACALLSVVLVYKIAAFCEDRLQGIFAGLILALSPIHIYFSRAFIAESMLMSFWLAGVYFFLRWTRDERRMSYTLSIVGMALGVLVKIFPIAFLAVLLPYGLYRLPRTRRNLSLLAAYAAVPAAAGGYWYLVQTELVRNVEARRFDLSAIARVPEYLYAGYPWRVPDNPVIFGTLVLAGLVLAIARLRTQLPILLVALGTAGYLVMVASRLSGHPYYSMHFVPAAALLAGAPLALVARGLWRAAARAPRLAPAMRAILLASFVGLVALVAGTTVPLADEYYGERLTHYTKVAEIARDMQLLTPDSTIVGIDANVAAVTANYYFDRPGYHLTAQHMHRAVTELEDYRAVYRPDYFVTAFTHLMPLPLFTNSDLHRHLKASYAPVYLHDTFVVYDIRERTDAARSMVIEQDFAKQSWTKNVTFDANVRVPHPATDFIYASDHDQDTLIVYRFDMPRPLSRLFLRVYGRAHPDGGVLEPYVSQDGRDFALAGLSADETGTVYDLSAATADTASVYVMFRLRAGREGAWTTLNGFELHASFDDAARERRNRARDEGLAAGIDLRREGAYLTSGAVGLVYDPERRTALVADGMSYTSTLAPGGAIDFRTRHMKDISIRALPGPDDPRPGTGAIVLRDARTSTTILDVPRAQLPEGASLYIAPDAVRLSYDLKGAALVRAGRQATAWQQGYQGIVHAAGGEPETTLQLFNPGMGPFTATIDVLFANYRHEKPVSGTILVSRDGVQFTPVANATWRASAGHPLTASISGTEGAPLFVKIAMSESDSFIGIAGLRMHVETRPLAELATRHAVMTNTTSTAYAAEFAAPARVPGLGVVAGVRAGEGPASIAVKSEGCHVEVFVRGAASPAWMSAGRGATVPLPSAEAASHYKVFLRPTDERTACRVLHLGMIN